MEFQSRLKRRHLMDLIAYIKTSKAQVKADDDPKGQPSMDFLEHCLFIGLMVEESKIEAPSGQYNHEVQEIT